MAETQTQMDGDGGSGGGTAVATASQFPDNIQAIGDQLANLTLKQAVDLQAYLKDEHGIEAPQGGVMVSTSPGDQGGGTKKEEKVEEPTSFNVVLVGFDAAKKMNVIKEYRAVTAAGLADSKAAVEAASKDKPVTLKDGLPKAEAEALKKKMEEAGGVIELK